MSMNDHAPSQSEKTDRRNLMAAERTKLAAERTFLAWIRTGMTSIGIGIALARFIVFRQVAHQHMGELVGQLLILWGICIFILALISYAHNVRQFKLATAGPPFVGLIIVTVFLIVVSSMLFWIVIE